MSAKQITWSETPAAPAACSGPRVTWDLPEPGSERQTRFLDELLEWALWMRERQARRAVETPETARDAA